MDENYDIIVIGAGFGGSVAAKLCADACLKTLIIERSQNVGDKVVSGLTIPFYGFFFGPDFIRNGNPPFERPSDGIDNYIINDLEAGDIIVDDSLKVPKPFSPIIAFGYNTYCKPFCQWQAQKAVESGAELRTSTTVADFIWEDDKIKGVITDNGEKITSKLIINSEGSQGLLAIKAGLREKYPPETISLADTYDYVMSKREIDETFGYSVKMCWGWDEQKAAPPLGYGNGLMVWPYRKSIHFMQDQCLRLNQGKVPNLRKLFDIYHQNITSKLPWWRDLVAPHIKLRARLWEGFEIYVGLNKYHRKNPMVTNGMILIGDVAGLESTELCDGVPAAWFSAEIAAETAIKAIKANDTTKDFLKSYESQIRNHPIIEWSISGRNRYNLRFAQEKHDLKKLKKYIHDGWGLGSLAFFTTPFMQLLLPSINKNPKLIINWLKMSFRYYQNWVLDQYDYSKRKIKPEKSSKKIKKKEKKFLRWMRFIEIGVNMLLKVKKILRIFLIPLANSINTFLEHFLPVFEPVYSVTMELLNPITEKMSKNLIKFVYHANPAIFYVAQRGDIKNG
mgnify:CR=1 FL=1